MKAQDVFAKSYLHWVIIAALAFVVLINVPSYCAAPNDEEYAPFAEEMSTPVGGMEGIVKNVHYPDVAKKTGVQGRVFLLIYVNEHGGADDVKVVKGIGAGCDEAAIAAAKKAKYTPGKSKGQSIKTKLSLAVTFKL